VDITEVDTGATEEAAVVDITTTEGVIISEAVTTTITTIITGKPDSKVAEGINKENSIRIRENTNRGITTSEMVVKEAAITVVVVVVDTEEAVVEVIAAEARGDKTRDG